MRHPPASEVTPEPVAVPIVLAERTAAAPVATPPTGARVDAAPEPPAGAAGETGDMPVLHRRAPGADTPSYLHGPSRAPSIASSVASPAAPPAAPATAQAQRRESLDAGPRFDTGSTVRDGAVSPPRPFVPPPAARPKADVSTTSMAAIPGPTPNATVGVGAVPFRPADPALAAPPLSPSPPKPRIDTGTALADGPLVDFSNLPQARSKKLAEPPPPTSDPNWTLGRFVELTVALAATPDRAGALARFGLNEDSHRAVATEWGGRITNDPALRLRFDELVRAKRAQGA